MQLEINAKAPSRQDAKLTQENGKMAWPIICAHQTVISNSHRKNLHNPEPWRLRALALTQTFTQALLLLRWWRRWRATGRLSNQHFRSLYHGRRRRTIRRRHLVLAWPGPEQRVGNLGGNSGSPGLNRRGICGCSTGNTCAALIPTPDASTGTETGRTAANSAPH
jgi:hypothetical protein